MEPQFAELFVQAGFVVTLSIIATLVLVRENLVGELSLPSSMKTTAMPSLGLNYKAKLTLSA
jgi:hypothetical protein